ncbi:major facilitator superfamily MFS_1 [Alkaliphilus metalliredigens QYMF]|uniref:Major facilitator superfamily MFS_1 n=1 Tax=Alkaliphilus metalliredigens (strain QYMF) TaxID=293826 RepID=A6TUD5_ALKMQ|nr:MFS transporter [Alkaliphilus metalliredigens]ABR49803.1 major facilitator superfamily MFS_1 [Alkaliphilus metalliredigens QYMF]
MNELTLQRRWRIWLVLVLAFVTVFFHRLAMGAVADNLAVDLQMSATALGNLTAMNYYAYAAMQIPVGIMVDTIGVRKISTLGMLLTGLGSILLGLATTLTTAYIARFLVGIGTSVIIVSIMKVQVQWFEPKSFSTLSGMTTFVGNIGALLATFPLTYLVIRVGWRVSFHLMGLISIVLAGMIWMIVRDKVNEEDPLGKESQSYRDAFGGVKKVITNPYTWPPFMIMFNLVGSITAITGLWGIPYMMHVYRLEKESGAWYIAFISLGVIMGAPLIGRLSDRLGGKVKPILLIATSLYTMLWVYMALSGGAPSLAVIPIIFLGIGVTMICHILAFTNVKEVNDIRYCGSATAFINVGEFIGGSFLSLAIGFWLDRGWLGRMVNGVKVYEAEQYQTVFWMIAFAGMISIISTLLMKDSVAQKEGKSAKGEAII